MMGSTHVYDVPAGIPVGPLSSSKRPDGGTVELTLDPSELDLVDTDAMAARYEQQIQKQQSQTQKEDLSDFVADHISRQKASVQKFLVFADGIILKKGYFFENFATFPKSVLHKNIISSRIIFFVFHRWI